MSGGPTIEERASALLSTVLAECVRERTRLGIRKYGQRLDENRQSDHDKAVHLVQELLDGIQYALWLGRESTARRLAAEAELLVGEYRLSTAAIMAGGKK